jgi:hypothetical protein
MLSKKVKNMTEDNDPLKHQESQPYEHKPPPSIANILHLPPELGAAEVLVDKLALSNKNVAMHVKDKILASNDLTAEKLVAANNRILNIGHSQLTISLVTLTLLILFAAAFFKYAIIVTVK